MAKNLYEILGVTKSSTDQEIKSAYRKLALQWHPDKHKGDKEAETKFKEINKAYEILSDKQKRSQYDTFGEMGGQNGGFRQGQGGGFDAGGFDFSSFSGGGSFADIFESFFNGGADFTGRKKRKTKIRGNDIETNVKISFEDAVFGTEKELEITKPDICEHCKGTGAEPGASIITCPTCHGEGTIRSVKNTILGAISTNQTCQNCEGEGKIPEKKCASCHGTTRTRQKERIKVKIPAGIDNGTTIRVSNKGEGGYKGGESGDLYINISVIPSKIFFRDGADIHSEKEIHLLQAVLGDELAVETIHGPVKIKIPQGTEDGKVFKIENKGAPKLHSSGDGHHFVKIKIRIPKKLSKKEKELYIELAKEGNIDIKKSGIFW